MPKHNLRKSLEINSTVKQAFIAGFGVGIDMFRRGVPLQLLGAADLVGRDAFANLFTGQVVDPATLEEIERIFGDVWKIFEGRQGQSMGDV